MKHKNEITCDIKLDLCTPNKSPIKDKDLEDKMRRLFLCEINDLIYYAFYNWSLDKPDIIVYPIINEKEEGFSMQITSKKMDENNEV